MHLTVLLGLGSLGHAHGQSSCLKKLLEACLTQAFRTRRLAPIMGAKVWQRGTGTVQSQDPVPAPPLCRPLKRHWVRQESGAAPGAKYGTSEPATAEAGSSGAPQPKRLRTDGDLLTASSQTEAEQNGAARQGGSTVRPGGWQKDGQAGLSILEKARLLREQRSKAEAARRQALELKRFIQRKEQQLAAEKEAKRQSELAEEEKERRQKEEQTKRKRRLDAGFAQAFREAQMEAVALAAEKSGLRPPADAAEVARVLATPSDHAVMQLRPGVDKETAKKKYRDMCIALHPDKCKVEGAKDAFQRLVEAWRGVSVYAR